MAVTSQGRRYRFGVFEADSATGELRRKGVRVRLHAQPFQVLFLLLERPGELLTREEISRELWPDGTFVDFDHGVNSAVNRLREALGDKASSPRYVETLARRGYRFVAPVERIGPEEDWAADPVAVEANAATSDPAPATLPGTSAYSISNPLGGVDSSAPSPTGPSNPYSAQTAIPDTLPGVSTNTHRGVDSSTSSPAGSSNPPAISSTGFLHRVLATPEDLPHSSPSVVQTLFILLQLMYIGFYVGALANLGEIHDLLAPLTLAPQVFALLIVTGALLIPVRIFLICAALFHAPGFRQKFLSLWPLLLLVDALWSLAPFLLLHHISSGLALACITPLVYSPFAQRSLILMGAGTASPR